MRTYTVYYRGGTIVTVYGNHLDSVAVPHITITVVVSRINNDTNSTSSIINTDSEVIHTLLLSAYYAQPPPAKRRHLISCCPSFGVRRLSVSPSVCLSVPCL